MVENCEFKVHPSAAAAVGEAGKSHAHSHEHSHSHEHGHTHEILEHPGTFSLRPLPLSNRNWKERAFTVGIGG